MHVTLSPHAEKLLRDQLPRGGRSPEEIVERALEILDSKIRRGPEELGHSESISGEGSRDRLRKNEPSAEV